MGKFLTAVLGVISGFLIAHLVNETAEGKAFFQRVKATATTFTTGVQDAYRS